jgi:hypothetical protein
MLFIVDSVHTQYNDSIIRDDPDGHTYFVVCWQGGIRVKSMDGTLCDLRERAYRRLSKREIKQRGLED